MALTTTAEYKAYAGITDTSRDTQIGVHLNAAEYAIRRYCGRNLSNGFETATRTEIYDGNSEAVIHLNEWPVTSITSVSLIDNSGSSTALETTGDYRVNLVTGELHRLGAVLSRFGGEAGGWMEDYGNVDRFGVYPNWPDGAQNVSVVYVGGYTTVPDDIKMAVWRMIDMSLAEAGANVGLQSESIGSYSYSRLASSEKAEAIRDLLGIYRTVLA